ncbi:MAG: hypothetical protein ACREA9_15850, partial [Pyrinomonadaceae bacterium]
MRGLSTPNWLRGAMAVIIALAAVIWPEKTALTGVYAQTPARSATAQANISISRADLLRGEYGLYRANNDLLYYHLDIRVDPEKKFISGKNTVRFRMLKDDTRIQLDLHESLKVE